MSNFRKGLYSICILALTSAKILGDTFFITTEFENIWYGSDYDYHDLNSGIQMFEDTYPNTEFPDLTKSYPEGTTFIQGHVGKSREHLSGLVAYYKFEEGSGSTANDSFGVNHGTLTSFSDPDSAWSTSNTDLGTAITFDGDDDYVDLGNPEALQITGSLTIEAWIKTDSDQSDGLYTNRQTIVTKAFGGEYEVTLERDGDLAFYHGTTGVNDGSNNNTYDKIQSAAVITEPGRWYHIAIVRDLDVDQNIKMYVDGVLIHTADSIFTSVTAGSNSVGIGNQRSGTANFNGEIDEVRFWNVARTEQQIIDNMGTPLDTDLEIPSNSYDETAVAANVVYGLESSSFGHSIGGQQSTHLMGEEILPPLNVRAGVAPTITPSTNAFYIDYEDKVYAAGPGALVITWEVEDENDPGVFINQDEQYLISGATIQDPVTIFWTEGQFDGPTVNIGAIPFVRIHYNALIEEELPAEGVDEDSFIPSEGLWINENDDLQADVYEGSVIIEYASSDQGPLIGFEIINVKKPEFKELDSPIGSRIVPDPNSNLWGEDGEIPFIVRGRGDASDDSSVYIYQHSVEGPMKNFVYGIQRTDAPEQIEIVWLRKALNDILWPYEINRYNTEWPTANATTADGASYESAGLLQKYIRGSVTGDEGPDVDIPSDFFVELMFFQEPEDHATLDANKFSSSLLDSGGNKVVLDYELDALDGSGYSLIRYEADSKVWFTVIQSVFHDDTNLFDLTEQDKAIGDKISQTSGLPGYIHATAAEENDDRYNVNVYNYPETDSTIFGVNSGTLEVWWQNEVLQEEQTVSIFWPASVERYDLNWASGVPEIILSSNDGTGSLSDEFSNTTLYFQNVEDSPGYNPNEEHAVKFSGVFYALRNDLNDPDHSEPYVLIEYEDENSEPAMLVYSVIDDGVYNYPMKAGNTIAAPEPIDRLSPAVSTQELVGTTTAVWRDKNLTWWAIRAGNDGTDSTETITMHYSYPVIEDFAFPGNSNPPAVGDEIPYLSNGDVSSTGTPGNVTYTVYWPDSDLLDNVDGLEKDAEPKKLLVGETLVTTKNELPDIANQKSVSILYQQSVDVNSRKSVVLIDPVRARTVLMEVTDGEVVEFSGLPDDIETDVSGGKTYFPTLPPHLRSRFFYDSSSNELNFIGEFVEPTAGEYYLLLNVIEGSENDSDDVTTEIELIKALSSDTDTYGTYWNDKIDEMATDVETLSTETKLDTDNNLFESETVSIGATELIEIENDETPFDSLALSAGVGGGTGYVTLAFNNSENLADPSDVVTIEIILVSDPLYDGELKVIESDNPIDEQLTLRHSSDFAGKTDEYEFEWRTLPPEDGIAPATIEESTGDFIVETTWTEYTTGNGLNTITISGPGLITLTDNYFVMRYRPSVSTNPLYIDDNGENGSEWSAWTEAQLAPGWIKRALDGLAPFEQRIESFRDNTVNTIVSTISQAGKRWEGNIALNLDNIEEFGLIEIYETILNRGKNLSIDNNISEASANDALLLAAGRLADLYLILGNEAFADAADPTIAISSTDDIYGAEATTLFPFMNQLATLLDEELALLRGRDDNFSPSIDTQPFYNRLIWNYTTSFTGGELAYALNYNIKDHIGNVDGTIDEDDAATFYPQGHGDAWGHYLTAIKNYYLLLRNVNFTWEPRIEAVLVGGVTVNVDFLDERNFALAATARAKTGLQIFDLTYRQNFSEVTSELLSTYTDDNDERAWGTGEWASRAGQAAYYDWIVGNSLLPDIDTNPDHAGIQIIDRTTVTELKEVASQLTELQTKTDEADLGLNPFGLAKDVVPFDINPLQFSQGTNPFLSESVSHFEQVYNKALIALNNLKRTFDYTQGLSQELRAQSDDANVFRILVEDQEIAFNNQLIEIFGYPYSDDIGAGQTYESGYEGPDLIHYNYVDFAEVVGDDNISRTFTINMFETFVDKDNVVLVDSEAREIEFNITEPGFQTKPTEWTGSRLAQGKLQLAITKVMQAYFDLRRVEEEYLGLIGDIQDTTNLVLSRITANDDATDKLTANRDLKIGLNVLINTLNFTAKTLETQGDLAKGVKNAAATSNPTSIGFSSDPLAAVRGALTAVGAFISSGFNFTKNQIEFVKEGVESSFEQIGDDLNIDLGDIEDGYLIEEMVTQLNGILGNQTLKQLEFESAITKLENAEEEYLKLLAEGTTTIDLLETFRIRTASGIQEFRQKDLGYRIFRNEALDKYQSLFDLAARYVYLAAKAYDYETALLSSEEVNTPGAEFLAEVVKARSIGQIIDDVPQLGNGLADIMARMKDNWDVLEGQLGFNNADSEVTSFSLRSELFRISPDSTGDETWRTKLQENWVDNILDDAEFGQYARIFAPSLAAEPGLIIKFPSTIEFGKNFFGWDLAGGDNAYDSSHFATKIKSAGVYFVGYNNAFDIETLGGGLANQPRVYLIPAGEDIMLSPTSETGAFRSWKIIDQKIPLPRNIGGTELEDPDFIGSIDSLTDAFGAIRKFSSFRAYHDGGFSEDDALATSRLIGRSVWNTNWVLIIPAGTLLSDRDEAELRFIEGKSVNGERDLNGVSDIKIIFETYSHSGN